ncbi:hypothetical protein ANN_20651 [Periplaneta americana]|uniref:CGG triplet repeat-binding protein 1 n=1 Tax=Periplaneta americana TaxID=6978 RepID=A0ABQ8SEI0_PERAM|nr:hypothetical protein ANN_20651 [Periplaneta americana]
MDALMVYDAFQTFGKRNILLLSVEFPQNIIPKLITEWKYAKYIVFKQKWKTYQVNSFTRAASVQFGKVRTVSIATTISSDFVARILIIFMLSLVLDVGYFSCAAQQLNASQSTHRFSFVNHTIKTVNMPKVRHSVNLKSKLTSYISEFKEDGLSTDNKILFCNLCQCAVSSTQKFLVEQHITTSKHQANKQLNSKQRQLFLTQPTTSNVRSEFNIDLCRSLISADIPLYKLKNKVFREFLEKYTQHTIPDESTLRKTYAPSIYDETIQKIRDEIKDSSIWVSIDETPDKEGRLVGTL